MNQELQAEIIQLAREYNQQRRRTVYMELRAELAEAQLSAKTAECERLRGLLENVLELVQDEYSPSVFFVIGAAKKALAAPAQPDAGKGKVTR